jgi:toxin ParE1/3/4
MKLIWTRPADADVREIRRFVAQFNPEAADKIRNSIVLAAKRLQLFPQLGRSVKRKDLRLFPVTGTAYLLIYQVVADAIIIASVVDGRMDRDPDLW